MSTYLAKSTNTDVKVESKTVVIENGNQQTEKKIYLINRKVAQEE